MVLETIDNLQHRIIILAEQTLNPFRLSAEPITANVIYPPYKQVVGFSNVHDRLCVIRGSIQAVDVNQFILLGGRIE